MDAPLTTETPGGSRRWGRHELEALADATAASRSRPWSDGTAAVPVAALGLAAGAATHATFHAADGYAASIPLAQAVADGVLLVPPAAAGRTGLRLVVPGASSACFNVKAVVRLELTEGPGRHTVDPDPHDNAFVPGWDER